MIRISLSIVLILVIACHSKKIPQKNSIKTKELRETNALLAPPMPVIVIDPGHGGNAKVGRSSPNNATGAGGTLEKDLALTIAVKVAEILNQAGYNVMLTRNNDVNLDLKDRAKVASDAKADVFLSIHLNADALPTVQGTETWIQSASTDDSRLLASSVQQRMISITKLKDRGLFDRGLGVLSLAYHSPKTATCLSEISFLTNPTEEARLKTKTYQNDIANGYAQAIIDYLNRASSIKLRTSVRNGDPAGLDDL